MLTEFEKYKIESLKTELNNYFTQHKEKTLKCTNTIDKGFTIECKNLFQNVIPVNKYFNIFLLVDLDYFEINILSRRNNPEILIFIKAQKEQNNN